MRRLLVLQALCGLVACLTAVCPVMSAAATAQTFTFDAMEPEQPASGFTAGIRREHGTVSSRSRANVTAVWCAVQTDTSAPSGDNVVTIVSNNRHYQAFPFCLLDGLSIKDVDLSARFKPISGKLDRAAGLILRARDSDNHYVVRANALENNVRLYRVMHGRRALVAGRDVPVATGVWQTLRVRAEGSRFEVYLDGKLLFEAHDRTFGGAGRVGLWVKSDSVTLFDDFAVRSLEP